MKRICIYGFSVFSFLAGCKSPAPEVYLVPSTDPDIVLVNIGEGDREYIGKLLLKIDSLKPIAIAINVFFLNRKTVREDSVLVNALQKINNDMLIYGRSDNDGFQYSESVFTQNVSDIGFLDYDLNFGLISQMTPLSRIDGELHESLAYKIVKHWKPAFTSDIKVNQRININYHRNLKGYVKLDGRFLLTTNIRNLELKDKVFLVGSIGQGNEDKFWTPLRFVGEEPEDDEPDTYGLVIIANQIRTLLEYNKQTLLQHSFCFVEFTTPLTFVLPKVKRFLY